MSPKILTLHKDNARFADANGIDFRKWAKEITLKSENEKKVNRAKEALIQVEDISCKTCRLVKSTLINGQCGYCAALFKQAEIETKPGKTRFGLLFWFSLVIFLLAALAILFELLPGAKIR